ncbi:MAG: transporter substrate-binding domain-containing protein [Dichotomicrobium sp.]
MASAISEHVLRELAPTGELRAAINLGNFLLVTGRSPSGEPVGVAPDMARAIADRIGVPVRYVAYNMPSELADAVTANAWDIGLIGAEPQRAQHIAFTNAYVEIEATYLVPGASDAREPAAIDQPGKRISVTERTAYGLWLDNNIKHAQLVRSADLESAFQQFVDQKLDALAGLRAGLVRDSARLPGSRVLDGFFTTIQQAIGAPIGNTNASQFLADFVEEAKTSGFVAELIAKHGVNDLSVAR